MKNLGLLIVLAIALQVTLKAQTIGLTLAGGGAKGLAHIGVIEELEKAGIFPDVISGTSMGSIVGGLYAIGYSTAELREFATNLDWASYFTDASPRRYIPIEERQRSDRYQLSFQIEDGHLVLPQGLLRGRRIQTLLSQLTVDAHGINSFDDFRYPFRAVATDLETGEAYVFSQGPLREAIRSSMAIPTVFAPVISRDGHLLVDGLVVRNLPVQDAAAMGADFLLAVDVGAPLYTRDELNSLLSIVGQTSSFIGAISTKEERALADFIIDPYLEPYTTLSYESADSIIARGAMAARAAMPALLRQLDSLGIELPMSPPNWEPTNRDSFYISEVIIKADQRGTAIILERLLDIEAPGPLSREELEEQVNLLYGSGFFDLIDFEIRPGNNGQELRFYAQSLSAWRSRFSINYDSDYDAALLVNLTGRHIGVQGSLLALDLKISENPAASFEYLLFTRSRPRIGLRLQGSARFYPGRTYDGSNLTTEFGFQDFNLQLSGLLSLSNNRSLEIGLSSAHLSQNPRFFRQSNNTNVRRQTAVSTRLIRDTYDRTFYPRNGSLSIFEAKIALSGQLRSLLEGGLIETEELERNIRLIGRVNKVFPLSPKVALLARLQGGLINSPSSNITNQLYLGRQITDNLDFFYLHGYRYMELAVSAFASAGLDLRVEIGKDNFLSLGYNYGSYAQSEGPVLRPGEFFRFDPSLTGQRIEGVGLELGTITAFGPFQFSVEYQMARKQLNYALHGGYYF